MVTATGRPLLVDLAARGDVVGRLAPLWVDVAEMVDWYDKANCCRCNTCDFRAKVDRRVLTVRHTCSATVKTRAQRLTRAQRSDTPHHRSVLRGQVPQGVQDGERARRHFRAEPVVRIQVQRGEIPLDSVNRPRSSGTTCTARPKTPFRRARERTEQDWR
ncbi:collagenase [Lentzea sp. NPDC051208]|uniref:collagenase n=1 Tax=Lentzea sp. NPDC051208 TaxID=3154642 RepID=UPI003425E4B9